MVDTRGSNGIYHTDSYLPGQDPYDPLNRGILPEPQEAMPDGEDMTIAYIRVKLEALEAGKDPEQRRAKEVILAHVEALYKQLRTVLTTVHKKTNVDLSTAQMHADRLIMAAMTSPAADRVKTA